MSRQVCIWPIEKLAAIAGPERCNAIGNVLIIYDKLRACIALVSPYRGTELRAAYCLPPRDRARGGKPALSVAVVATPAHSPGRPTQVWVRRIARCPIRPQQAGEAFDQGGPLGVPQERWRARHNEATPGGRW